MLCQEPSDGYDSRLTAFAGFIERRDPFADVIVPSDNLNDRILRRQDRQ